MTEWEKYYRDVMRETYRSLSMMPRARMEGVHCDHIAQIKVCFKYGVPVAKAGGPGNLRFIKGKRNMERGYTVDDDTRKKLRQWGYDIP